MDSAVQQKPDVLWVLGDPIFHGPCAGLSSQVERRRGAVVLRASKNAASSLRRFREPISVDLRGMTPVLVARSTDDRSMHQVPW